MIKILKISVLIISLLGFENTALAADALKELKNAREALEAGNYDKAFAEYKRFAEEKNNPLAQFIIALFYQNGWGRSPDPILACQWHEKAAKGDIPASLHSLAECLERGIHRPADPESASELYKKAADLGHLISQCSLAKLYFEGKGVPKNPVQGLKLCQDVANRNSHPAQTRMGRFFLEEKEIMDYDEAFKWFSIAAQTKSAEAQYYLGVMFRDGLGRDKQPEAARYWFESAAAQGYVPAYFPTSYLYFNAPVDPETKKPYASNLAKAYLWLTATSKRSIKNDELSKTSEMLNKVLKIMPDTWVLDLDEKVAKHLEKYAKPKTAEFPEK